MLHFNAFVLSKNSFGSLCPVPSKIRRRSSSSSIVADYTARDTTTAATSQSRRTISAQEARLSLVFALASQASTLSQRGNVSVFYLMIDSTRSLSSYLILSFFGWPAVLSELASETSKYLLPKRFESRNLEEALMAGISI